MLTMVVGECSSGKSVYIRYLRSQIVESYLINVDDERDFPTDDDLRLKVYGDDVPLDGLSDKGIGYKVLLDICRKCSVLLIDEIGLITPTWSDARIVMTYISDISKYKDIVMVTHDFTKLYYADKIVTVDWDKAEPRVMEINLDEAEKIVGI